MVDKLKTVAEWRGWIWFALVLLATVIGWNSEMHKQDRSDCHQKAQEIREEMIRSYSEVRADLAEIRGDIKMLLVNGRDTRIDRKEKNDRNDWIDGQNK